MLLHPLFESPVHIALLALAILRGTCAMSATVVTTLPPPVTTAPQLTLPPPNTRVDASDGRPHFFCPWGQWGFEWQAKSQQDLPLLCFFPGLDGSGLTPFFQYPELGRDFEVKSFKFGRADRLDFAAQRDAAAAALRDWMAQHPRRKVFLFGDSYGGLLASGVALALADTEQLQGIVLSNPATSYEGTRLAMWASRLCRLPGPLFNLFPLTLALLTLDRQSLGKMVSATRGNRNWPEDRIAAADGLKLNAWLDDMMGNVEPLDRDTLRFRLKHLLDAGCEWVNPRLRSLPVPALVVCGTHDRLLPSRREADRLEGLLAPNVVVHRVNGAGHAGTLDDRVALGTLISEWRERFNL